MSDVAHVSRLNALEAALRAERSALIANDIDGLLAANQQKLSALEALESNPPPASLRPRVQSLSQLNRANGNLLSRRRRAVDWALRHLGRTEAEPTYDAQGRTDSSVKSRRIASA